MTTARTPTSSEDRLVSVGLAALALVAVVGLLVWAAGEAGALVASGRPAGLGASQAARVLVSLPGHLDDPARAWPVGVRNQLPGPLGFWALMAGMVAVTAGTCVAAMAGYGGLRRGRTRGWPLRPGRQGREGTGLGDASDARSVAYRGPSLAVVPGPARFVLGLVGRRAVWCPEEGNVLVLGPARSRKSTGVILPNLRRWPGGCVVTSLRPEAYRWAVELRGAVGPVRVFDPAGVLGAPEAVSWWPWRGAEDWDRAVSVARSMTEGLEDRGTTNSRHFAERAAELLAPILHAAALERADLRTVRSWVAGKDTAQVIAALRLRDAHSAADDLAGFHTETEEGSGKAATVATARRALAWAARDRIHRSLDPRRAPPLDVEALFEERATLVMVSPARDQAELAPLMTALLACVVAAGQERAFAAPTGRLDPAFAFILDEVATIAPWDGVPELMATGGGFGMPTLAACQDLAQLAARFGPDRAQTIWNNATARLITRGSSDRHTEEAVTRTAGERLGRRRSGGRGPGGQEGWQEAWEQVIHPGELSRLPIGTALLLATGARPLHVTLVGDRTKGG